MALTQVDLSGVTSLVSRTRDAVHKCGCGENVTLWDDGN